MYSVTGLSVWVVIGILWAFCSAFAVVLYPLWESRTALMMILKGMVKVSRGAQSLCWRACRLTFIKDIYVPGSGAYVPPTSTKVTTA